MKTLKDLKLKEKNKVLELSEADMKKELVSIEKTIYALSMKLESNELKQTHLLRFAKKYVALLKTVATKKGFKIS